MNTFDLKPTPGTIITEEYKEASASPTGANSGSITLSDSMKNKDNAGIVLAVGKDGFNDFGTPVKSPAKVGDIVFFTDAMATPYYLQGKRIKFLKFWNILAVKEETLAN